MQTIALIGSGPTALYTAAHLIAQATGPLAITLFEAQDEAGKGTPYHPDWNDPAMLANIASIEIPRLVDSLEDWLRAQGDTHLAEWNVKREQIDPRAFFPRVVLGEYFSAQLRALQALAITRGVEMDVLTGHRVSDIELKKKGKVRLTLETPKGQKTMDFDHAVMATGHAWPERNEVRAGYFQSPWPASGLRSIGNVRVGIRGTSLSAIDAVVALASARGKFLRDSGGAMRYEPAPGTKGFHLTLMSRKGLLPEADFFHPIPYEPLAICTPEAVEALAAAKPKSLLDAVYDLFRQELRAADPDYADRIGLEKLSLEQFARAYFGEREAAEPFEWAAQNLAEAQANYARRHTVPWRYTILRMHEAVALAVPHLSAADHGRFMRSFKPVFVDDYATVPHESIERLLALNEADKIDILRLGEEYMLDTAPAKGGVVLHLDDKKIHFPAFIEAVGQRTLSLRDLPFPSLQEVAEDARASRGGLAIDEAYRLRCDHPAREHLYCLSLPFILSQFPFAQGITSSHEMGTSVAENILKECALLALPPAAITPLQPAAS